MNKQRKIAFQIPFSLCFMASLAAASFTISSPDQKVKAEISDVGGRLRYQVVVDNQAVITPSDLSILSDGAELGQNATLGKPRLSRVNERYRFFGAKKEAVNRAQLATVPAISHGENFELDIHVANDGVGVRLRLPAKAWRKIEADHSSWRLAGDPVVWAADQEPAYESTYKTSIYRH